MVWLLLSVIIGKLSVVKVQLMQYQVHLVNSSCPSVVLRRYSQPWASSWRLLVTIVRQLFNQSLVYCRLSSTNPIIIFLDNLFIWAYDKTTIVELFKGNHHQETDEYPFSVWWSCSLSKTVGGILEYILVILFSFA